MCSCLTVKVVELVAIAAGMYWHIVVHISVTSSLDDCRGSVEMVFSLDMWNL